MPTDESRFLRIATQYYNDQIVAGNNLDVSDSRFHILKNLREFAPEEVTFDRGQIDKRLPQRRRQSQKVRKANLKRWWLAFRHLENLISAVDIQNEDLTDSTFREIIGKEHPKYLLLNVPDTVGGPALKCLLILSLHARACSMGAEILSLLEAGHVEGAMRGTRTLYEIAVVVSIIQNDGIRGTYELSERYYVTSILERMKYNRIARRNSNVCQREQDTLGGRLEKPEQRLINAARRTWGPRFKEQYDWARPVIPNERQIRKINFTDLERACEAEWMRPTYLELNNAIHAGPTVTISRTKFRGPKLNPTGPTVEPQETSRTGHAASFLLMVICDMAGLGVCRETKCWDDDLIIGSINEQGSAAIAAFQQNG
jgi:hypothetical protein